MGLQIRIELEQEDDGRWIADVLDLPGVIAYGDTQNEALKRAEALALRVMADQIEADDQPSAAVENLFAIA